MVGTLSKFRIIIRGVPKEVSMGKTLRFQDNRDKIIDQLIDDKNRIYTKLKREQKENAVLKSQIEYWKQRHKTAMEKIKELSNEINNDRSKK